MFKPGFEEQRRGDALARQLMSHMLPGETQAARDRIAEMTREELQLALDGALQGWGATIRNHPFAARVGWQKLWQMICTIAEQGWEIAAEARK